MSASQDQPTINIGQRKLQLSAPKLALIASAAVFDCKPLHLTLTTCTNRAACGCKSPVLAIA
ncbi:hypothetical protein FOM00_28655 [Pseudomonas sp. ST1]|nr:hypothetical protein DXU85_28845 [Pseudomonas savastanoi]TSC26470.1 hypothetical protein FOM00_28655 [Pseudomonas sp. ST1]